MATIPNITDLSQAAAIVAVESAGLIAYTIQVFNESVAAGYVASQVPESGVSIDAGSTICLLVSKGTQYVVVPEMIGRDITNADADLNDAGLMSLYDGIYSDTIPLGQVVSQNPAAGASVLLGSTVEVIASRGAEQSATPEANGETPVANMLRTGTSWLAGKRVTNCSDEVVYQRPPDSYVVNATYGDTAVEVTDESGMTVTAKVWDFIIQANELNFDPEPGDIIEADDRQYEVLSLNGECWRWSDPFRTAYRIHTKDVGAA